MDDRLLREYRLGRLDPARRQEIETRAFEDDDLNDRIEAAGYDLLDDWARGSLSAEDRSAVERIFAPAQLAIARSIHKQAPRTRSPQSWLPWAIAAAMLLCLVPGAYYWREVTRPLVRTGAPAPLPLNVAALTLSAPATRGGAAPLLRVPPATEMIRFDFEVEPGYALYEVQVRSAQKGLVSIQTSAAEGSRLRVLQIPALLPSGGYDFLVTGIGNGSTSLLATYSCRIERE